MAQKSMKEWLLHSIGVAYKNLGDIATASFYKKEALSVFEAIGSSKAERVEREVQELELLRIINKI